MADVRGASGVPPAGAFGGIASATPSTPLYIDTANGNGYVLISGVVTKIGAGAASTIPVSGITGLGTGVATALAVNVGSAGAFVTFNGALGTPSSGTATNLTGTATALSIGGNAATATLASTVTTNANLTGPITSSGNATTIASLSTAIKLGTLTRVMNTASGDVSYTGVGFQPSKIIFLAEFDTTGWNALSAGFDDATSHFVIGTYTSATFSVNGKSIDLVDTAGSTLQNALVKTMDSDGFTLTWTLLGAGNAGTATVFYMAFK